MICDMDCLNCSFSDCINDSDLLSTQERKSSNDLDKEILNSRLSVYIPMNGARPYKLLPFDFKKSQQRHYHRKQYYKDVEKSREQGRQSYYRNRDIRQAHNRQYYAENREVILKSRKENYVPHPKQVIDTPEAQRKRERERERYLRSREEINRKRREKRRKKRENHKNK